MDRQKKDHRMARFCIWTLYWQRHIAYHIRVFSWGAAAIVLLLALGGKISLETALSALMVSLISIAALIWLMIQARRTSLLRIEDPGLREAAHEAMVVLIQRRSLSAADKKLLRKKFGERHCELGHCLKR